MPQEQALKRQKDKKKKKKKRKEKKKKGILLVLRYRQKLNLGGGGALKIMEVEMDIFCYSSPPKMTLICARVKQVLKEHRSQQQGTPSRYSSFPH